MPRQAKALVESPALTLQSLPACRLMPIDETMSFPVRHLFLHLLAGGVMPIHDSRTANQVQAARFRTGLPNQATNRRVLAMAEGTAQGRRALRRFSPLLCKPQT